MEWEVHLLSSLVDEVCDYYTCLHIRTYTHAHTNTHLHAHVRTRSHGHTTCPGMRQCTVTGGRGEGSEEGLGSPGWREGAPMQAAPGGAQGPGVGSNSGGRGGPPAGRAGGGCRGLGRRPGWRVVVHNPCQCPAPVGGACSGVLGVRQQLRGESVWWCTTHVSVLRLWVGRRVPESAPRGGGGAPCRPRRGGQRGRVRQQLRGESVWWCTTHVSVLRLWVGHAVVS